MERTIQLTKQLILLIGGAALILSLSATVSGADPLGELLNSTEVLGLRSRPAVQNRDVPPDVNEDGEYWALFKDPLDGPTELFNWLGEPGLSYKRTNKHVLYTDDLVGVHGVYEDADGRIYTMQVLVPHPKRFLAADAGLIKEFHDITETGFESDAVDKVQVGRFSGTVLTRVSGQCLLKIPLERHAWFTVSHSERCDDPASLTQFAKTLFLDRVNLKLQR